MQCIFDIGFSGIALILLPTLLPPLMFVLRVTGEREISSPQNRVEQGGKHLELNRLAIMLKDSLNVATDSVHNDPRILLIGGFFRKTKISELTQLINLLNDDLDVIGIRLQAQRCFDALPLLSQDGIIEARLGLSGIGSIVFGNEEELVHANSDSDKFYEEIAMSYKGALEEWYDCRQNMMSYFSFICLTMWVVLGSNSDLVWNLFKDLLPASAALDKWV
jgi:lipopolysaccharide/colanic/teichoic acid biosynthesis glycosyltransferase